MNVTDPVFEDNGQWFFWGETGTQFLGPFPSYEAAHYGLDEYGQYLADGTIPQTLIGTRWKDGESTEIKPTTDELRDE